MRQPQPDQPRDRQGDQRRLAGQQHAAERDHRHDEAGDPVGAEADRTPGAAQPLAQQLRTRHEAQHELVDLAPVASLPAQF
jgi:hypothetical protein